MLQILVCLNGYGKVWMRGSWHRCGQGDAYITPARIPHAYEGVKWEVGWIHYEPEIWGFVRLEEPVLQKSDPRLFGQILQGLYYEAGHRAALPMLEHWTELLHEEARRMMESDRTERLWALWQAVQADLAAPWSVTQLASRAGMGGEHLRVLCRKEMGRSPMEQVAYLRMHHAVSLLTAGHKAHVVAETVGYDNAFAFSTAFKRVMGRSPREYRNA